MDLRSKILVSRGIILTATRLCDLGGICILVSGGKDSTVLVHLIYSLFNKKIPFPVVFGKINQEETEEHIIIDNLRKRFAFNFITFPLINSTDSSMEKSIKKFNEKRGFDRAIMGTRGQEHQFSPLSTLQKKYGISIYYPLFHWLEREIWEYIKINRLPYMAKYSKLESI